MRMVSSTSGAVGTPAESWDFIGPAGPAVRLAVARAVTSASKCVLVASRKRALHYLSVMMRFDDSDDTWRSKRRTISRRRGRQSTSPAGGAPAAENMPAFYD
jgi:hypothetical protein